MKAVLSQERIKDIKQNDKFKEFIEAVKEYAEEQIKKEVPVLDYSAFKLFEETGDRAVYETPYFEKRRRFNAFSVMYLIYKDEKYKYALEDCIWDICNEYTWALPAHMGGYTIDEQDTVIDLFASETGAMLAELLDMAGNDLAEHVVFRAKKEIRRRIIKPYTQREKEHYWWHNAPSNWAAVCAYGVGSCIFYQGTKEDADIAIPRLLDNIDAFLKSYGEDGCCLEGYTYWNYGFGRFVFFADLLKEYTNGSINLFESEKVHNIAKFQQNVFIGQSQCVSFADAGRTNKAIKSVSAYLCNLYDDVKMPSGKYFANGSIGREFVGTIRDLAWFDPSKMPKETIKPEYVFYEDAQWYIRNADKFSLAAKGGHNNEPHNHNDLGSFIFIDGNDRILDDYGSGRYTRQYFSDERYTYLLTSSRGHSVPIINGKHQSFGEEYRAAVLNAGKDNFEIELNKAYSDDTLILLKRSFDILNDGVKITDKYKFSEKPKSVDERFFTCIKPVKVGKSVKIGSYILKLIGTEYDTIISEEEFYPHNTETRIEKETVTAYLIDFEIKNPDKEFELKFELCKDI